MQLFGGIKGFLGRTILELILSKFYCRIDWFRQNSIRSNPLISPYLPEFSVLQRGKAVHIE